MMRVVVLAGMLAGCGPGGPPVWRVAQPDYAMPFCTRTLGMAQCFADPEDLLDRPTSLGDMPVRLHAVPPPQPAVID